MGPIEGAWIRSPSRRQALVALGAMLACSPKVLAQLDPRSLKGHRRVPGLGEMMTAFDFEPICFANMPLRLYDYMAHGGDSEWSIRRNRQVFDWVDIVGRGGVSPQAVDTTTSILGLEMDSPLMIAPSTRHHHLHPDAEAGTYRGASPGGGSSGFKRLGRRRSSLPSISRQRGSSAISTTAILVEIRRAKASASRTMKTTKKLPRAAPSFTGCPCPDAFGTTGNIWTRYGLSSTSRCSSRVS